MWELDHKESWALKNWCFWTVVLAKTLESPLDCKEIQPVHPKGDQSWVFIGRTDVEAEAPILWPPGVKNWLTGKDTEAGTDWGQKGMAEDEMVGWHHRVNGQEFEQALGVGDGRKPGVLKSLGSQRVGHDWATELNSHCLVKWTTPCSGGKSKTWKALCFFKETHVLFSEISDFTRFGTENGAYQALNLKKTDRCRKNRNFLFCNLWKQWLWDPHPAMEENRHCILEDHNSLKVMGKGST